MPRTCHFHGGEPDAGGPVQSPPRRSCGERQPPLGAPDATRSPVQHADDEHCRVGAGPGGRGMSALAVTSDRPRSTGRRFLVNRFTRKLSLSSPRHETCCLALLGFAAERRGDWGKRYSSWIPDAYIKTAKHLAHDNRETSCLPDLRRSIRILGCPFEPRYG